MFTTRNVKTVGPAAYAIVISLNNEAEFNGTMMYQITTPVEITNQKNYQDSLSFSVNINGTDAASKIDHTFVEFRHSKYKNKGKLIQ